MARYTEAVCRICRREGDKLFLKGDRCYTDKCAIARRSYAPGVNIPHAGQTGIHGPVVQIHNLLAALLEIAVVVALLHLLHGHVNGNDLGELEEGRLENGVDTVSKAQLPGDLGGVHDVEFGVLVAQVPLHLGGQALIQLLLGPGAVQ